LELVHPIFVMDVTLQLGARVYLRNCVAGEPGCVMSFDRRGKAEIHWPDMPEQRNTFHAPDTLILDESFQPRHLGFEFQEAMAA